MDELIKFLSTPVLSREGKVLVTFGTFVTMGVGAGILYYCIDERKRKNLF